VRRRFCTFIVFIYLLVSINQLQTGGPIQKETVRDDFAPFVMGEDNSPIVIKSNSDFSNYGWGGDGSEANPYTLDGISLYTYMLPVLEIRDTDAYFVLSNSFLKLTSNYQGGGIITLTNVTNGIISNCQMGDYAFAESTGIQGYQVANISIINCLITGNQGIFLEGAINCVINGNRITPRISDISTFGIYILSSNQMLIYDNTVLYKQNGIQLMATDNSILYGNSIYGCYKGLGLDNTREHVGQSEHNTIYNNSIGWSENTNVFDFGFQNRWDDNISVGNAYSDYNESGDYIIFEAKGIVDRYPRKLIDDLFGPRIIHHFQNYGDDFVEPGPVNFTMYADVTDISGVDTVLLNFNGTVHKMNRSMNESTPNSYYTVFPYRGIYTKTIHFYYAFIANDTQGNYFETTDNYGDIALWHQDIPYSPIQPIFPLSLPFIIAIIIPFAIIGTCVAYVDRRWTNEKIRYDDEFDVS